MRSRPHVGFRNTRWTCIIWEHGIPLVYLGAKCPTQQNEHLVFLNTSGDVLVKMLEKVRAHFTHTGSGRGPTLLGHKIEESFILK